MGHHRKARASRPAAVTRRVPGEPDQPPTAASALPPDPATVHDRRRSGHRLSDRALEDLVDAARVARRTGWPFGIELLASVETHRVPTSAPADGLPRRYATHQPTEPFGSLPGDGVKLRA